MAKKNNYMTADERKFETVKAVIDLASEQNPAEITTNEIAKKMGLTQGAIFRHFPNKDSILEATLQWVAVKLLEKVDKAARNEESCIAALKAMFLSHVNFVYQHPGVPRMLFGELQKTNDSLAKKMVLTLLKQYQQRLKVLFKKAVTNNELKASIDIEVAIVMYMGMVQGLVVRSLLADKDANIKEFAPKVFDIYIAGLKDM